MGVGEIDVGEVDGAGGRGRPVLGHGAAGDRRRDGRGVLGAGDRDGDQLVDGAAIWPSLTVTV